LVKDDPITILVHVLAPAQSLSKRVTLNTHLYGRYKKNLKVEIIVKIRFHRDVNIIRSHESCSDMIHDFLRPDNVVTDVDFIRIRPCECP